MEASLEPIDRAIAASGNSTPGHTARYYRGAALYHLGRLDEAIEELTAVVDGGKSAGTVGAAAESLLAHVYVAAQRTDDAISLLSDLADRPDPALPADQALLQLGRIHDAQGNAEEARKAWQRVVDEFPESGASREASRLLGS